MRHEELKQIQERLGIELPSHYISFHLNFNGFDNAETDLQNFIYNNVDTLTEMNQLVGFHLNDKIVKNKLVIGDNGGGDFYVIDLKNPLDKKVYVFDHEESLENFDKKSEKWIWDNFESHNSLEDFKASVEQLFGLR